MQAPPCAWHPQRPAVEPCAACRRPICPACVTPTNVGYLCPECVQAWRARSAPPPRQSSFGEFPATVGLIAANVVMFVLSIASAHGASSALAGSGVGSLLGGGTPLMGRLAIYGPAIAQNGEYYRLVTAMFMHFGVLHIGMNMWALWVLGRVMENAFGSRRFLQLYLLAGLGGNVAAYVFQPDALSAGASTAVFGLFSALFLALKRLGRDTSSVVPIIILNFVFTFSVPGISIAGHVGGFLTGAVVGGGFAYAPAERKRMVQRAVLGGTLAVLAALTVMKTGQLA